MKKVLFVSVHPDDETLGCGGTILKHAEKGDEIYWLILTSIDRNMEEKAELYDLQKSCVEKVAVAYGFKSVFMPGYVTTELDRYPRAELVRYIADVFSYVQPEEIYLPNRSDVHSDHRIAFQAVFSCMKSFRSPFIERILMYETLSETECAPALCENAFVPNVFVDISLYFAGKTKIMELYDTEVMDPPFPRSIPVIEALARFRGSRAGVQYAEAYVLLYEKC